MGHGKRWCQRWCLGFRLGWLGGGGYCFVAKSTLATPWTVCSPPASSVHGISQARILEWVALLQGTFPTQDRTQVSWSAGGFLHCRWILYQLSHQRTVIKTGDTRRRTELLKTSPSASTYFFYPLNLLFPRIPFVCVSHSLISDSLQPHGL